MKIDIHAGSDGKCRLVSTCGPYYLGGMVNNIVREGTGQLSVGVPLDGLLGLMLRKLVELALLGLVTTAGGVD